MEIKAVFFDIDGTLVNDSRTVLKSTEKAIKSLKDQGILVGLATGRGPYFVEPFMKQLDLDFAVTYNGQYIFSREKVIAARPIDKQHLTAIIDFARKKGKEIALGTKEGVEGSRIMSFGLSPASQWGSQFVPKKLSRTVSNGFNQLVGKVIRQDKEELLNLARKPIYQVLMLATPKETLEFEEQFQELKFTRSSPYAADIINQGVSKLEGIKLIAEEFGFDISQVMAFGDSDNDIEMLSGVGLSIAMGNSNSRVKEVAKHTTSSNSRDGIHRALEHFGILASEKVFVSADPHFNKVKNFHRLMDGRSQEEPRAWDLQDSLHRSDFKLEEIVEFVAASAQNEEEFDAGVQQLHQALDKAQAKVKKKDAIGHTLTGQADALVDMLYLTYGTFALMGVDPEKIFDIVHQANMGKIFPDGKAHFDPVTHKILKPDDWEEKYAPEPAIEKEIQRQLAAYQHREKENQD